MEEINKRRVEVNKFALLLLDHIQNHKFYNKINHIYPNIDVSIKSSIKEDDYKIKHHLHAKFAEKMNEINYETLCEIACDVKKITGEDLPRDIHNRIIFGKMNEATRDYIKI